MNINRDFEFPLKDDAGKEQGKVKFNIENAEIRDEIVLKGKKATALKDKTFLIINLKITNGSDKTI
ncbi:MAG: hypothetical protein AABY22_19140, partial [Nanoarchaeota archaeon]